MMILLQLFFLLSAHAATDLILYNGRVLTGPATQNKWAAAVSVSDGMVRKTGGNSEVLKDKDEKTVLIDLKGRVVLPGFNDAHLHIFTGGLSLGRLDLTGVKSLEEFKARLRTYDKKHQGTAWIFGLGWDHTAFKNPVYPSRQDLDSVVANRPVFLWHIDEHFAVVNTKALEILKIDRNTEDPDAGKILKDASGNPTGMLIETAAAIQSHKVDNPTPSELKNAFIAAQREALKVGLTSIQGGFTHREHENYIRVVESLHKEGLLKLRVGYWGELEDPAAFLSHKNKFKHIPESVLKFTHIKGFVDGVISSYTAALSSAYSDNPKTSGPANYPAEKLDELVLSANKEGIAVALHAIGDRAVDMAVTAFEKSRAAIPGFSLRNRIEHLELGFLEAYPRMQKAGIVASVQPSHMIYDTEAESYNDARLGAKRVQLAFAWKNLLDHNVHTAFGTDWPVMPLNPIVGLMGAVYRRHYNGKPAEGWVPKQKITMAQAIESYTLGGAYASGEEKLKGSIEPGKFADFAVYAKDPFKVSANELLKLPCDYTIIGGKIVYQRAGNLFPLN